MSRKEQKNSAGGRVLLSAANKDQEVGVIMETSAGSLSACLFLQRWWVVIGSDNKQMELGWGRKMYAKSSPDYFLIVFFMSLGNCL
jgi:hypothetical protein